MSISGSDIFYLYKITNLVSMKEYVGITSNFERRMHEHKNESSNKDLRLDIAILGWGNFKREILVISTKRYIENLELAFLLRYRIPNNMYNKNNGGPCNGGIQGEGHGSTNLTDAQVKEIFELYNSSNKLSYAKLAAMFDITEASIGKIVRGATWKHLNLVTEKTEHSERFGKARNQLTVEDVELIKYMYNTGEFTYEQIASELNFIVSKTAVGKIIRGERWKQV